MAGLPRIAVVGAGLAGLTAAWHLKQAGLRPTVFEASAQPGGRMQSAVSDGVVHDLGAWTFVAGGKVDGLAQSLGLARHQVTIPSTIGRPFGGRLRVGHLRNPFSLAGPVFSPVEIFHLLRVHHQARTLPARRPDETAQAWAARSFPAEFKTSILAPLAGLFFLQSLDGLSRDAFLNTLRYLARVRLMSFRRGMGYLAVHLGSLFDLRCGQAIKALHAEPDGIRVGGDGFAERFDGALVATPLPEALRLTGTWLDPAVRRMADKWPRVAAMVVHMHLKRRFTVPALQILPPRGQGGRICGFTIERAKHPARVPPEYEALTVYVRPERVAAMATRHDRDIAAVMAGELKAWTGVSAGQIMAARVRRWPYALTPCDPAADQRIAPLKAQLAALATRLPVWTAGDYLGPSSLEAAVGSGIRAARACQRHFEAWRK